MEINSFLKRASDRNGFTRERYEERKIPTDMESLVIFPFFGDYRSLLLLSSWFLHRYKEQRASKYLILASWNGFAGMFPYVNEYWSITDESQVKRFWQESDGFKNNCDLFTIYKRNLNEFFRDVVDYKNVVEPYYNNGITQNFWDEYRYIKQFLPFVPSSAILNKEFNRELVVRSGYKIFIHPTQFVQSWNTGKVRYMSVNKEFWVELVKVLKKEGFVPVIWQNKITFDLSPEFNTECLYVVDKDISKVLSTMRSCNCVLDVFNGISRLAIVARSPFLALDERSRYFNLKEQEVDDLCGKGIPKDYIFTFANIVLSKRYDDLFEGLIKKLNNFLPNLDRENLPSTGENIETVLYDNVRKNRVKKIGTKFIKIDKIL